MTIANPRIHMICGVCGSNKFFEFKIDPTGNCDKDGEEYPAVSICCKNCSTITHLDEIITECRRLKKHREKG